MQLEYFSLIDRIVDLNVGERTITAEAQVPTESTIFEGHFPGYPIMPGVLLIEAMAQTSGWLLIGLATSLGEGLDTNWDALNARRINVDEKSFAPYVVHPFAPVNLDTQIPKKGDQRQMEAWQRIGTYAAGLALDSAGVKGNKEILARMDMIVAAGGGERDLAVDCSILTAESNGNAAPGFLNERLMNDLRPTLFLAQLSNLLAGNIAIVHGVTGSSRPLMGEEAARRDAAPIA